MLQKKSILTAVSLLVATLFLSPLMAQKPQFLGLSDDTAPGNSGLMTLNQMCDATFVNSQTCTSQQILDSGSSLILSPGSRGWVIPNIISVFLFNGNLSFTDVSGVRRSNAGGLSCRGWSSSNGELGLAIAYNPPGGPFGQGSFVPQDCQLSLSAACCRIPSAEK